MIQNKQYTYRHNPLINSYESIHHLMTPLISEWIYEQKVTDKKNILRVFFVFFCYSNLKLVGHFLNHWYNEIFM